MRKTGRGLAAALLALALAGCSVSGGDVETLLRAPRLSGETSAVQKALNSYLGSTASLKYPASGNFLSPFLFGDWDGDGAEEAAVLYTADASGSNVCLAVLEQGAEDEWQVTQTAEGLASEVESVSYAHLRDADSQQIMVGYGSAQGDQYMVVYQYSEETLQVVIQQTYTDMILTNMTGGADTVDLILALPTETEAGGINLQLLSWSAEEDVFRSAQTLAIGAGSYNGCAGLHTGGGMDGRLYLVVDGWAGNNSLASTIVVYDEETNFLQTYTPPGVLDTYRATLRYDTNLVSMDLDGNGTIDIPSEVSDGGVIGTSMENRLKFLVWKDYTDEAGGKTTFGVYDSEYRFFLPLPESLRGVVQLRANHAGDGWVICGRDGTVVYCELRVVNPAETEGQDDAQQYTRVANIGSQQLQARVVTGTYGLRISDIADGIVVLS